MAKEPASPPGPSRPPLVGEISKSFGTKTPQNANSGAAGGCGGVTGKLKPRKPTSVPSTGGPAKKKCKITSQTFAVQPPNRARTTVGVGEQVKLTFSPGSAKWSISGGGKLSAKSGSTVTFTAPCKAGNTTITAVGGGCSATITFKTIEPNSVNGITTSGPGHVTGQVDIGERVQFYVGPDTVNFYKIQILELESPAPPNPLATVGTGVFAPLNGAGHGPNPLGIPVGPTVKPGYGTEVNGIDDVHVHVAAAPPFAPGTLTLHIPWQFKTGTCPWKTITTLIQQFTLDAAGKLTASKGGAHVDTNIGSPTTPY